MPEVRETRRQHEQDQRRREIRSRSLEGWMLPVVFVSAGVSRRSLATRDARFPTFIEAAKP